MKMAPRNKGMNILIFIGIFLCNQVASWAPQLSNALLLKSKRVEMKSVEGGIQKGEGSEKVAISNWLEFLSSSICGKQNFLKFTMTKNDRENEEEGINSTPGYHDTLLG